MQVAYNVEDLDSFALCLTTLLLEHLKKELIYGKNKNNRWKIVLFVNRNVNFFI